MDALEYALQWFAEGWAHLFEAPVLRVTGLLTVHYRYTDNPSSRNAIFDDAKMFTLKMKGRDVQILLEASQSISNDLERSL